MTEASLLPQDDPREVPKGEDSAPLDAAILRHAPLLVLHPKETFTPCDPSAFLVYRDAQHVDRRNKPSWWLGPGCVRRIRLGTAEQLVAREVSAGSVEGRLTLRDPKAPDPASGVESPPLVEITRLPDKTVAVTYWFFWADNHAVAGFPRNALMSHEGDWERLVLRLDPELTPTDLAYHAHGGYKMVPWAKAEKVDGDDDRPVVWVARGSHASYPTAGWQKGRPFDSCAKSLEAAKPFQTWAKGEIVRVETQEWYRIGVRWGDGPRSRFRSGASPFGPGNRTGCPAAWFQDAAANAAADL